MASPHSHLLNTQAFVDGHGPAFKDWSSICSAIGAGVQHLIVRKGGIAEGRAGFAFKHPIFALFPTEYHAQAEQLRPYPLNAGVASDVAPSREQVAITTLVKIERAAMIAHLDAVEALEAFHLWKPSVLAERFAYGDQSALHLAVTRAYRLKEPWIFPYERRFGGCRSWITLPAAAPRVFEGITPVLSEDAFEEIDRRILGALEDHPGVEWLPLAGLQAESMDGTYLLSTD